MAEEIEKIGPQPEGSGRKNAMDAWAALLSQPLPGTTACPPLAVRQDDAGSAAVQKTSGRVSNSARRFAALRDTDTAEFPGSSKSEINAARESTARVTSNEASSRQNRNERGHSRNQGQ